MPSKGIAQNTPEYPCMAMFHGPILHPKGWGAEWIKRQALSSALVSQNVSDSGMDRAVVMKPLAAQVFL